MTLNMWTFASSSWTAVTLTGISTASTASGQATIFVSEDIETIGIKFIGPGSKLFTAIAKVVYGATVTILQYISPV